jgi:hypothetical protein
MANYTNLQSALSTLDSMDTLDNLRINSFDDIVQVPGGKNQVEQPDLSYPTHGGIHNMEYRCYDTRTCLLCNKKISHCGPIPIYIRAISKLVITFINMKREKSIGKTMKS